MRTQSVQPRQGLGIEAILAFASQDLHQGEVAAGDLDGGGRAVEQPIRLGVLLDEGVRAVLVVVREDPMVGYEARVIERREPDRAFERACPPLSR